MKVFALVINLMHYFTNIIIYIKLFFNLKNKENCYYIKNNKQIH